MLEVIRLGWEVPTTTTNHNNHNNNAENGSKSEEEKEKDGDDDDDNDDDDDEIDGVTMETNSLQHNPHLIPISDSVEIEHGSKQGMISSFSITLITVGSW